MHHALRQAQLALTAGHTLDAVLHANIAAGLARSLNDLPAHDQAKTLLVQLLFNLGRVAEALRHAHELLMGAMALNDGPCLVRTQTRLALALSEAGLTARGEALAAAAHDEASRRGLHTLQTEALLMRGALLGRLGHAAAGEQLLQDGLARAREAADHALCLSALNSLLLLLLSAHDEALEVGDTARAQVCRHGLQHCLPLALAQGMREGDVFKRAVLRSNAGAALRVLESLADAEALLRGCVQASQSAGFSACELRARIRLADVLIDRGRLEAAQQQIEAVHRILVLEPQAAAAQDGLRLQWRQALASGDIAMAGALRSQLEASQAEEAARRDAALQFAESELRHLLDQLAPLPSATGPGSLHALRRC
jgi:hypothetical protein